MRDSAASSDVLQVRDGDQAHAVDAEGSAKASLSASPKLAVAHPGGIMITTHVWISWLRVAIDHAAEARRVRDDMHRLKEQGEQFAELLGEEFVASAVAILTSAMALDALYGSEVMQAARRPLSAGTRTGNRAGHIHEALKQTFDTGPVNHEWAKEFADLFSLRDRIAHFGERVQAPEPHPEAGFTSPEHAAYTVEKAEHYVNFALSVFRRCVDRPKADAETWATSMRSTVDDLEHRWAGLTGR
jgi:hypothetical protein